MADASAALVDVQFALPPLAKLPEAALDKETVDTAIHLAALEHTCIIAAAEALAAKGMPFAWEEDLAHARHCAALIRAAVESAAAEAAATSKGVEKAPVRLFFREPNQLDYSTFVGFVTDVDGRKYKVTYEPLDAAARPARMSSTWYDDDEVAEEEDVDDVDETDAAAELGAAATA